METTPPNTPEPAPPTPPSGPDERQWKTFLHLSALIGLVLPTCGNIVGPLVIWLLKKQELPGLEAEGRKVLNFQISATIYMVVLSLIGFIACVFVFLPLAVFIWWLVYTILGAVKASNNESIEFPLTIKFL
jgi:uncharacterized Tic20 family protein